MDRPIIKSTIERGPYKGVEVEYTLNDQGNLVWLKHPKMTPEKYNEEVE